MIVIGYRIVIVGLPFIVKISVTKELRAAKKKEINLSDLSVKGGESIRKLFLRLGNSGDKTVC